MKLFAGILLAIGLLQMVSDLLGFRALKGLASATMISPAPKVFCSVQGLETYSTRFFLEWTTASGAERSVEITQKNYAGIRGPYNRRNVYGAALAYAPVLAMDPAGKEMLRSVLAFGLLGDAPLLSELGIEDDGITELRLRFEPRADLDLGDLPLRIDVPLP